MTNFYRFPAMAKLDEFNSREQMQKIKSEFREATRAEINYRCCHDDVERENYGTELMDIIHATETALRMEFSDEEIDELQRLVIAKNAERGYYDD